MGEVRTVMGARRLHVSVHGATYQVWERGVGQPLLFLHGFTGAGEDFLPLMRALSARARCLAVDLPGHGDTQVGTDLERFTVVQTARDLRALCAQIGAQQPVLIGYSFGGRVALSSACLYPSWPRALVLESASPGLFAVSARRDRQAADEALAQRLEQVGTRSFMRDWAANPLFASQRSLTPQARRRQERVRNRHHPSGLAASLRAAGTGAQPSWWEALAGLSQPTLLLTGALDEKFSEIAAEMTAHMQRVRHVTVAHAGHNVHLERPNEWLSHVRSFLAQLQEP